MASFRWLHISDLHQGITHQRWLWPDARERFFNDLKRIFERTGPWDFVLFTGDLTQRGSTEEFSALRDTLGELWQQFAKLGCNPALLLVPGNHDLVRPDQWCPTARALRAWHEDEGFRDYFWDQPNNEYIAKVSATFAPYSAFARSQSWLPPGLTEGLLPGDFSATVERSGARLGIVGLNSAFLQQSGDSYEGKLDLDPRQLHAVCNGDAPKWLKERHANLLLTHHPPSWLKHQDRFIRDIALPGRFAVHLFGHLHSASAYSTAVSGSAFQHRLPGASLFGLHGLEDRVYGYSAGRITIDGESVIVRVWPRKAILKQAGNLEMQADSSFVLEADEGFELIVQQPHARSQGLVKRDFDLESLVQSYRTRLAPAYADWEREPMMGGEYPATGTLRFDDMYHPVRVQFNALSSLELVNPEQIRSLLGTPQSLTVRGAGGAGKTIWLRWVFRSLLLSGEFVPILVALRDIARRWKMSDCVGEKRTLDAYLADWGAEYGIDGWKAHWRELLAAKLVPKPVLLLDGWDEVGPLGNELKTKLIGFLKQFPGLSVIVTSRLYGVGLPSDTDGFQELRIQPLSNDDIVAFAGRFYQGLYRPHASHIQQALERFVKELHDSTAALELARTPLLLTLMLHIGQTNVLPDKRHLLYEECIDRLLTAVPERKAKDGALLEEHQWVPADSEERRRVVAELAVHSVSELGAVHSIDDLERRLPEDWPPPLPGQSQRTRRRGFLAWLAGPAGLMTEDTNGLRFTHICLHEYLVARYYADNIEGTDDRAQLFVDGSKNLDAWEILRLYAAILNGRSREKASELLWSLLADKSPREAQLLAGTMLADGVGDDDTFNTWKLRFNNLVVQPNDTARAVCFNAWRTSRQHAWREAIAAHLSERASHARVKERLELEFISRSCALTLHAPLCTNTPQIRQMIEEIRRPGQSGATWILARRLLLTLIPEYPWHVEEDARIFVLNTFWPSSRVRFGVALQLAVALGMPQVDINKLAEYLIRPSARDEVGEKFAHHARAIVGGIGQLSKLTESENSSAAPLVAAVDDMLTQLVPLMRRPASGITARAHFKTQIKDLPRAIALAQQRVAAGQTSGSFWNTVMSISGDRSGATYYGFDTDAMSIEDFGLIASIEGNIAAGRLRLFNPPGISHVAHLIDFAYRACLSPVDPAVQQAFETNCSLLSAMIEPVWSALARHVAGRSTEANRALLRRCAANPEEWQEPLGSMLRYIVRGDVPLADGTVLVLDDVTRKLGMQPLSYLDEFKSPRQPDTKLEEDKQLWAERFKAIGTAASAIGWVRKKWRGEDEDEEDG